MTTVQHRKRVLDKQNKTDPNGDNKNDRYKLVS